MFNEDLKKRYIKEKTESATIPVNYLECQFNKVEKYERELNKDVCNFTVSEISEYYKTLNVGSLESLIVMNSHFSQYAQFCMNENLISDGQNHFLELDNDVLKRCVNTIKISMKIVDRNVVVNWCEQLPNPKDQVAMLGLFEGLKGKDFVELSKLKPEDVDFENKIVHLKNRDIIISDKLVEYIKRAITETIYYSVTGSQKSTSILADRGYVIKYYPNSKEEPDQFLEGRKIYSAVKRSLNYVGANYMSANGLNDSGKIYLIKKLAAENNMTPVNLIYSEHFKEVLRVFNCKRIVRNIFISKYEDYLL